MYAPAQHDEITGLINYLDQQLIAIRSSAFGLTEEQARLRPCRSELSIGGLVKHIAYVMDGALQRLRTTVTEQPVDEAAYAAFMGSFAVEPEATVEATIKEFDDLRDEMLAVLTDVDPDAEAIAPPTPWNGIFDARPIRVRYYLVHLIEEVARHAGHADIIREQIDGMAVPALVLSLEGAPANDFFAPYEAQPGTLLAGS